MLGCEHTLNKSGDTRGSPTAAAAATDVSGVKSKFTAVNGREVGAATRKAVRSCVKPSSHFRLHCSQCSGSICVLLPGKICHVPSGPCRMFHFHCLWCPDVRMLLLLSAIWSPSCAATAE